MKGWGEVCIQASGSSGQGLCRFQWHCATVSISTLPWIGSTTTTLTLFLQYWKKGLCSPLVQRIKFTSTHFYTRVERSTLQVKFLVQEHNTVCLVRAQTQTTCSRGKCTNHGATVPPLLLMKDIIENMKIHSLIWNYLINLITWWKCSGKLFQVQKELQ